MPVDKSSIAGEFDAKARRYEQGRLGPWYIAQSRRLCDRIEPLAGDCLDIGCGSGWMLRTLASRYPQYRFLGIDLSPRMIETARERAGGLSNLEFLRGDWETLDESHLKRYAFAQIICTSTFHYFACPPGALARMYSALSPGGRLHLIERNTQQSPMTQLWGWLHLRLIGDHVTFYGTNELMSMLKTAGFCDVRLVEGIRRYLWHGKLQTNIAILAGRKPPSHDQLNNREIA